MRRWLDGDRQYGGTTSTIRGFVYVSPLIAGASVNGPAGKMMFEQGPSLSVASIAKLYRDLIDGFIVDGADIAARTEIESFGIKILVADIFMKTAKRRCRLESERLTITNTRGRQSHEIAIDHYPM